MAAYLEVIEGRSPGRRYALAGTEHTIGRDEGCEVSLLDESASRRHAQVLRRGERFILRDLGSRNGTRKNGARVDGEAPLRSGDDVTVGATRLRFVDELQRTRDTAPLGPAASAAEAAPSVRVESVVRLADPARPAPTASLAERRLRALLDLGRAIAAADDPDALLALALAALPPTLAADRAAGALLPPGGLLDAGGVRTVPEGPSPPRALLARALEGEDALLLSPGTQDAPGASLLGRESVVGQGVRAVVAAPILSRGARRGLLYADRLRSGGRFDDDDLAFLAEMARQLGAALAALDRAGDAREESEAWRRIASRGPLFREKGGGGGAGAGGGPGPGPIGEAPSFRAALDAAERVARADSSVLLLGETGAGKEVFARHIHERSGRKDGPFVALNCAALPEALLESELFGHERGAFTGAHARRRGLFELAKGGSVFLDEVGEMPPALQAKLLRVLETRTVRRVGAEAEAPVDFRLVAATNRDLEREVRGPAPRERAKGTPGGPRDGAVDRPNFREDLYFRLAVFTVRIPPLRERPGDAELLAQRFVQELGPRGAALSKEALSAIRRARWPGNVRELRNAVERAIVLAGGPLIGPEAFLAGGAGDGGATGASEDGAPLSIAEAERRAILAALRHTGGKKGEAARLLGIAHPTLNRKLREYGVEGGDEGE